MLVCEIDKYLTDRFNYDEAKKAYIRSMIKEKIINFIHRNEIDDEKYLTDGGSSVIMTAKWIRNNTNIALKDVAINEKTDTDNDEFIKEIKIIEIVHSNKDDNENKEKISSIGYKNVINFFGLTGDKSGLYLVYEYADLGNLRYYLSQNNLGWKQKVNIARQTVCEDMISGKFYGSDIDQAKPSE
ncbi:25913_t:CDS:2 [Gigaspora rosea]|nr:25913_t:CDS:2 [Gigaspora rosea]